MAAEFWGDDLRGATFRYVDLTGARITHSRVADVEIDADVERLVVNGVDVTDYVHERDEWCSLRSQLHPTDPAAMRQAWAAFAEAWEGAIERAARLPDEQRHASVDGEWSFAETLRHLVFAVDKWYTAPVLGGAFHPTGLPNSGSVDVGWPGLDPAAAPTFDDAVAVWRDRAAQVGEHLDGIDEATVAREVDVLENGPHTVGHCVETVLEEHFWHLRYATRDLDRLT